MIDSFRIFIDFTLMLESFLALYLLCHMFPLRAFPHRNLCIGGYYILYSAILILQDYYAVLFHLNMYPVFLLLHVILMFLFALIFCAGKTIFKLFLPLVFVSFITLSGFPINLAYPLFMEISFPVFKFASSFILISITAFLLHFKLDTQSSYPFSYYIIMIVMPVLNMFAISALKEYAYVFPYVNQIGFFTLILELLIYYTVWQSTTEYAKNIELRLIGQQQQYQNQHMEELRDIITDYHQIRHDMKNHFVCMDRLLSQEKYGKLKEYFYSLSKDLYALDNQIETGNEIVNQVINIKYATAHRLNIPMEIQSAIPAQLAIPDHLLCAVLSNLLDNAIEASEQIEHPAIFIKINIVKSYLSITVRNRMEDLQMENAKSHKTSKEQAHLHGLGLKIVQETVQKYNGISAFEVEGEEYIASVMLECM